MESGHCPALPLIASIASMFTRCNKIQRKDMRSGCALQLNSKKLAVIGNLETVTNRISALRNVVSVCKCGLGAA